MTDLPALIEKLERAKEGSRELDEAIAKAVGALPEEAVYDMEDPESGARMYRWPEARPDILALYAKKGWEPGMDGSCGYDYTTSLDAARALIHDTMKALGCPIFTVQTDFRHFSDGDWCQAEITVPSREFRGFGMDKDALARAWCAAALRAKAFYPQPGKVSA